MPALPNLRYGGHGDGFFGQEPSNRRLSRDEAVVVEFDFTVDDPANAFDQTLWFVVFLSDADNLFQIHSVRNGKRGLLDDLVPGIQFGNDEMACRTKC